MKGLPEGIERIAKRKENGESSGDHFSKVYSQSFFWAGLAAKLKLHSVRGGGYPWSDFFFDHNHFVSFSDGTLVRSRICQLIFYLRIKPKNKNDDMEPTSHCVVASPLSNRFWQCQCAEVDLDNHRVIEFKAARLVKPGKSSISAMLLTLWYLYTYLPQRGEGHIVQ